MNICIRATLFLVAALLCGTTSFGQDDAEDIRLDAAYFPAEVAQQVANRCPEYEYNKKRNDMAARVRKVPGLGAAWLRAGFHDCITATKAKPGSGCNGSLRFELEDARNARLQLAIDELKPFIEDNCLNWADGFMMAVEATMLAVGGPSVRLVMRKRPRVEATNADGVDDGLLLPSEESGWGGLVQFYAERGLSQADLVASSVGGHALGGFTVLEAPELGVLDFTPTPTMFNTSYAVNLLSRIPDEEGDALKGNMPGFNTLPSDEALIEKESGRELVEKYVNNPNDFMKDFRKFLKKMGRLQNTSVSI